MFSGIIPARFMLLTSHIVIVIVIFFARDENVKSGLPVDYQQDDYTQKDNQIIIALSISLGLALLEYIGFFLGVSTFHSTQNIISISAHASASIALAYFLFDIWKSDLYWYIFGFCSALPAVTEILTIIGVMCCGQGFY